MCCSHWDPTPLAPLWFYPLHQPQLAFSVSLISDMTLLFMKLCLTTDPGELSWSSALASTISSFSSVRLWVTLCPQKVYVHSLTHLPVSVSISISSVFGDIIKLGWGNTGLRMSLIFVIKTFSIKLFLLFCIIHFGRYWDFPLSLSFLFFQFPQPPLPPKSLQQYSPSASQVQHSAISVPNLW